MRGRLGVHNDEGVQGLPVAGQRLLGGRHLSQGSLVVTDVQRKILSSMETFSNTVKCLLDAVENPLSLFTLSYFMFDWIASCCDTGTI